MMSTRLFLCVLLCVLSSAYAHDDDAMQTDEWNAYEYFAGDWEIYRTTASFSSSSQHFARSLPPTMWSLAKANDTDEKTLVGYTYVNGTDKDSGLTLRMTFDSESSGVFSSGSSVDSVSPVFHFHFYHALNSVAVSLGKWHEAAYKSDKATNYMLTIASSDRFTISVFPSSPSVLGQPSSSDDDDDAALTATGHETLQADKDDEIIVFIGHRVKIEVEKSFFQKYGLQILMCGMVLLNIYFKSRQSSVDIRNARALAQANTSLNTKKGGAKIEEITEASANKKDK